MPRVLDSSAVLGVALRRGLHRLTVSLVVAMLYCMPVGASATPFTFNPNSASPSLAGPGSAFTADGIAVSSYLTAVNQSDASFIVHQYLPVTGFTLGGATVASPGLGSSYGLYFEIMGTGKQPTYYTLDVALKADPGNLDGTPVATATGVGFTNTGITGAADDVVLATGTLVSANLAFNPVTGVRNGHFVDTFTPAPGEAGFFAATSLGNSVLLDIQLTTNPNVFTAVAGANGTTINYVNGAFGTVQLVPEPGSLLLLCSALGGLAMARRRRHGPSMFSRK